MSDERLPLQELAEREHLSIGEVLNLLQDEFPDITISKIRFLESQGLLDPERTPSGYRKFYQDDIDRLRWILRQQRENFLPLKVIKDRLAAGELDGPGHSEQVGSVSEQATPPPGGGRAGSGRARSTPETPAAEPVPASAPAAGAKPARKGRARGRRAAEAAPAAPTLDPGPTAVSLSLEELVTASGLPARTIGELEGYGLITRRALGPTTSYDEDALTVARLAATFIARGVEPRHLRMYKVAADREAGILEQLVMPLLRQRDPTARQEAIDTLEELAGAGEQLRAAMLRQALRGELGRF
jgi:DNA-binding transcriptional MerR regulator